MKKCILFIFCFLLCFFSIGFLGCGVNIIDVNLVEKCGEISTNLFNDYFNKEEIIAPTEENFYVLVSENEQSNLTSISINNVVYKADSKVKFSVGNNNFLETEIWKQDGKNLYLALPTLYVEAKGGTTKIEAEERTYFVRVYNGFGNLSIGEVGAFGDVQGASASKSVDSAGNIKIEHTRQSGKTFVGWEIMKNGEFIEEGRLIYTKKLYVEDNIISYGIDISVDAKIKGYSSGLYNYYENGAITNPINRVIDYTIAIPEMGNLNFKINIKEKIPE